MIIHLSPVRRDDTVTLAKAGDTLIVNGEPFDFSDLAEGGTIPRGAVPCPWISGEVERIGGEVILTVILPYKPDNPPPNVDAPEPLIVSSDGPIQLPEGEANVEA